MIISESEWHRPANKSVWRKSIVTGTRGGYDVGTAIGIEIPADMDPSTVTLHEMTVVERA